MPATSLGTDARPQTAPARRYAALLYCARSGSTFLAYRLAEVAPAIAVIPEFRLPLMLFWRREAEVRALSPEALLALMRDDDQIGALSIAPEALPDLAARAAGLGARGVIETVVDAHLAGAGMSDRRVVLLKNSEFALNGDRAAEAFPEIRGLHVVRDPRGVANSMIRARQPYDGGGPMGRGNALHAARLWRRYLTRVAALDWPVLEIRYEALVETPEAEASRAAEWLLSGETAAPAPAAGAGFAVAAEEAALHRLAAGAGVAERAEAWSRELSGWKVAGIEALAGDDMRRLGYALRHGSGERSPSPPARARLHDLAMEARHYAGSAVRLAAWSVRDRRRARIRLRQFLARLRGRN